MGGRKDYEERRQKRIERYNELSQKAKQRSNIFMNSRANKILSNIPMGQPILTDPYSAKSHIRLIDRAHNDIQKSIEEDKKSNFYNSRAKSVQRSKVIYNDDPNAIAKLKDKLERLEKQKIEIKSREHETWELTNIGANIRETKLRIARLEEQESLEFPNIEFNGGKAVHNKDINRIQLIFENIPDESIRKELKHNGFHWSRTEGAWQREFNKRTINTTNILIKNVLNKQNEEEEEAEL